MVLIKTLRYFWTNPQSNRGFVQKNQNLPLALSMHKDIASSG